MYINRKYTETHTYEETKEAIKTVGFTSLAKFIIWIVIINVSNNYNNVVGTVITVLAALMILKAVVMILISLISGYALSKLDRW